MLGYIYVQSVLETKLGFQDTCGVNNLHGMPSILGATFGAIFASLATEEVYGAQLTSVFPAMEQRDAAAQATAQAVFLVITFFFSLLTGALTGFIVKKLACCMPSPTQEFGNKDALFSDEPYWEVPHLEEPYYFDRRGEIQRGGDDRMEQLERKVRALKTQVDSRKFGGAAGRPTKQALRPTNPAALEEVFDKMLAKLSNLEKN